MRRYWALFWMGVIPLLQWVISPYLMLMGLKYLLGPEILVRRVFIVDVSIDQLIDYVARFVVLGLVGSYLLIVLVCFAMWVFIGVRRGRIRLGSPPTGYPRSTLTERFALRFSVRANFGIAALLALGSLLGFIGERGAAVICIGFAFVVFGNLLLLSVRVDRGYFGGNPEEAVELIEFAANERNSGRRKPPPTSGISRPYSPPRGKSPAITTEIAAGRA